MTKQIYQPSMKISEIIDFALPVTDRERRCSFRMQQLQARREKLAAMIEQYRRGDIVTWEALKLSVDIEQVIREKLN